jgi:hypothetical protein
MSSVYTARSGVCEVSLVAYAARRGVEGDLTEERPAEPRRETEAVRHLPCPGGLIHLSLHESLRAWSLPALRRLRIG